MKRIFFLLVLANLIFFGYMQFGGGRSDEPLSNHEPLNADKIRLLGMAPPAGAKPAKPQPPASQVCLEWGSFTSAELDRAKQALEKLNLGDKLAVRDVGEHISYWVLIPPLKSKQEAERKMAQVKALGIDDVSLVPDSDKLHNAVSLGVFSTADAANKYLADIREKGIHSAKVEARGKGTAQANLFVKDASEAVSAELVKIKLDFPNSELKAVACDEAGKTPAGEKK